jgi:hypothetical protein
MFDKFEIFLQEMPVSPFETVNLSQQIHLVDEVSNKYKKKTLKG